MNKKLLTIAATGFSALGSAALIYGALVESKRLTLDSQTLKLKGWPDRLNGFKIAVLADFHIRDQHSVDLAMRAVDMTLDEEPDMVAIIGDFVGYWKPESPAMLGQVLEPFLIMDGNVVAVPGNHEYRRGSPEILRVILDELNIKLLRNENWHHQGITWVGIDSHNADHANVEAAFAGAKEEPRIVLWHEPDVVDQLPAGEAVLQLSGHSHGGQFRPFGITPMTSRNGKIYKDGFYPDASTPIFVTRGVGTTGPPSRFNCPPQVAILTLESA
jgi:uncharacterized protein